MTAYNLGTTLPDQTKRDSDWDSDWDSDLDSDLDCDGELLISPLLLDG